jgi:hypothetical protein
LRKAGGVPVLEFQGSPKSRAPGPETARFLA